MVEAENMQAGLTDAGPQIAEAVPVRGQRIEANDSGRAAEPAERSHGGDSGPRVQPGGEQRRVFAGVWCGQAHQPVACPQHRQQRENLAGCAADHITTNDASAPAGIA